MKKDNGTALNNLALARRQSDDEAQARMRKNQEKTDEVRTKKKVKEEVNAARN